MKRKTLSLMLIALSVFSLACLQKGAVAATAGTETPKGNILIGVVTSMTGDSALQGEVCSNATKLAAEEINAAGGINGRKIELIVGDSQTTNPGTVAAFQKVASEKVCAVVGPIMSTNVLAMMPYTSRYKVPILVGATSVMVSSKADPWIFRARPGDTIATKVMSKYLLDSLKIKKAVIVNDTEAFGTSGRDNLLAAFNELGFKDLGIETKVIEFAAHATDLTAQLVNIKQFNPDAICCYIGYIEDCGLFLNQAKQMGINTLIIGSPGLTSASTVSLAKENAEGIYGVTDFFPDQNEASKKYAKNYLAKYGKPADNVSSYAYDSMYILAKVIAQVGDDPQKIADGIRNFKDWTGAEGYYDYTTKSPYPGDGLHAYSIIQIKNGKQSLIDVVDLNKSK